MSISRQNKFLKIFLLKEVDKFWSGYLESLNKIRSLIHVKIFLPKDPQEAFFEETKDIFGEEFKRLDEKIKKMCLDLSKKIIF
jgi:preprotein translocase subunit SecA